MSDDKRTLINSVKEWRHIPRLVDNREVLSAALKWHAELHSEGLTNVTSLTGLEQAVYAIDSTSGYPSGIIVFYLCEDEPYFQVDLAYTNKFQRKAGIFGCLFEMLKTLAAEQDVDISIGTHVSNARMRKVLCRLGATEQYMQFTYKAPRLS